MIKLQRCTHKLYIHTNYVILALLCIVANYIREVSFLTHDIALIFKDDWFIRLEGDGLCTLLLQLLDWIYLNTKRHDQIYSSTRQIYFLNCSRGH